ncbi:hypothetical protein B296_00045366, partial [Ensete ventricosum]
RCRSLSLPSPFSAESPEVRILPPPPSLFVSLSASFASPLRELSFDPLRVWNLAAFANSRSNYFRVLRSFGVGYTLNVLSPFRIFFGILFDFAVSWWIRHEQLRIASPITCLEVSDDFRWLYYGSF